MTPIPKIYTIVNEELERKSLESKLQPKIIELPKQNIDGYVQLPSGIYIAEERSLGNLDWDNSHKNLLNEKLRMAKPREQWDLIFHCKDNSENLRYKNIYDEYLETGGWRAEWSNAIFVKGTGFKGLDIAYVIGRDKSGDFIHQTEPLEECVWEDCYVDISSPKNINRQGMPTRRADNQKSHEKGKNIYHWFPRENSVGRLDVNSSRANFNCNGNRWNSNPSLRIAHLFLGFGIFY